MNCLHQRVSAAAVFFLCLFSGNLVSFVWSATCGDGRCESADENCSWCPEDCGTCESVGVIEKCVNNKMIAFSFDDGPFANTEKILDILKRKQVLATFFFMGEEVSTYGSLIARALREGHQVATHTLTHPDLTTLSITAAMAEVNGMQDVVSGLTNGYEAKYMRPPFGSLTETLRKALQAAGYKIAMWNLDPNDWEYTQSASLQVFKSEFAKVGTAGGGFVTVQHGATTAALNLIEPAIDLALSYGYKPVRMDQCAGDPTAPTYTVPQIPTSSSSSTGVSKPSSSTASPITPPSSSSSTASPVIPPSSSTASPIIPPLSSSSTGSSTTLASPMCPVAFAGKSCNIPICSDVSGHVTSFINKSPTPCYNRGWQLLISNNDFRIEVLHERIPENTNSPYATQYTMAFQITGPSGTTSVSGCAFSGTLLATPITFCTGSCVTRKLSSFTAKQVVSYTSMKATYFYNNSIPALAINYPAANLKVVIQFSNIGTKNEVAYNLFIYTNPIKRATELPTSLCFTDTTDASSTCAFTETDYFGTGITEIASIPTNAACTSMAANDEWKAMCAYEMATKIAFSASAQKNIGNAQKVHAVAF